MWKLVTRTYYNAQHWDWRAIFLCVGTAFTFWIFHSLNGSHTTNINVGLNLKYSRTDVVAIEPPPERITVNATGDGWNLLSKVSGISRPSIDLFIDEPTTTRFLTARYLLPQINTELRNIQVNYILNDTVFFNYDTLVFKTIALQVDTAAIKMHPEFKRIEPINITPGQITLTGPSTLIEGYPDTLLVNIGDNEVDRNYADRVVIDYTRHPLVTSSYSKALVDFKVQQYIPMRDKAILRLVNFPDNFDQQRLMPSQAWFRFKVRSDSADYIPDSLVVTLDYANITADSVLLPSFQLPDYLIAPRLEPDTFQLGAIEK